MRTENITDNRYEYEEGKREEGRGNGGGRKKGGGEGRAHLHNITLRSICVGERKKGGEGGEREEGEERERKERIVNERECDLKGKRLKE